MDSASRQIVFINAAHLFCHYSLLILPTAVLAMAVPGGAFGSEYGPIVALATGMFVLYGVLSLPQGWLVARLGRKALMVAFFLGTGAALAMCALAATPWALGLGLAAAGRLRRSITRWARRCWWMSPASARAGRSGAPSG